MAVIEANQSGPAATVRFIRAKLGLLGLISALALVPCFWHRHIEAGDLGSHLYNAWLATLIEHHQAPGLWIQPQLNNVLFDWMLVSSARLLGLSGAEKISVALCVLVMFWGSFALICALSRRVAWFLIPASTVLTYGWVFHAGFFNFYLALGLSFWALAAFCAWHGPVRLSGFSLLPLIWLANPFGMLWLLAAATYVWLVQERSLRRPIVLLLLAALILAGVHHYLWTHFDVEGPKRRWFMINGIDQIVVLSNRFRPLAAATFFVASTCFVLEAVTRRRDQLFWRAMALPAGLYVLTELAVVSLPSHIFLPQYAAPLAYMVERLSLISGVLACGCLGNLRRERWLATGLVAVAITYFALLYRETGKLNSREEQVVVLVASHAQGQRVLQQTVQMPGDPAGSTQHYLDRACIERCFAYGNYEPSSLHFRIRSRPGSPIVMSSAEDSRLAEIGQYVVKPGDVPVFQISYCNGRFERLCIRDLHPGEQNGRSDIVTTQSNEGPHQPRSR